MSMRWPTGLAETVRQRWLNWMDARAPSSDHMKLTQRNIYIVPVKAGLAFACVTLVLLLAAINEQLNLAYALAFLLGGVGLSAMSTTHANLRGLTLRLQHVGRAHAGQPLPITLRLEASREAGLLTKWIGTRQRRCALSLGGGPVASVMADVPPGEPADVVLQLPTTLRGWQVLPRWRLASTYPLGLFRAWAYWRAASRVPNCPMTCAPGGVAIHGATWPGANRPHAWPMASPPWSGRPRPMAAQRPAGYGGKPPRGWTPRPGCAAWPPGWCKLSRMPNMLARPTA
jgi:hypothetical protein